MKKSEMLQAKINYAEVLVEKARALILEVFEEDEFGNHGEATMGVVMTAFDDVVNVLDGVSYDVVMPLQNQGE